jgi:hypothetical protein
VLNVEMFCETFAGVSAHGDAPSFGMLLPAGEQADRSFDGVRGDEAGVGGFDFAPDVDLA